MVGHPSRRPTPSSGDVKMINTEPPKGSYSCLTSQDRACTGNPAPRLLLHFCFCCFSFSCCLLASSLVRITLGALGGGVL